MIGDGTRLLLAHAGGGGGCSLAEALTTAAVVALGALALIRPWRGDSVRKRVTSSAVCVVLTAALTLSVCGGRIGNDAHETTRALVGARG